MLTQWENTLTLYQRWYSGRTNEASLLWERREAIGGGLKEDEELRELMELLKLARRTGDYVYWETSSLSSSIEATGYALMALSSCGARCASDARACVRWLSAHRHAAGGFLSTQVHTLKHHK
ncbi:hypothetical protein evm_014987 [Chilo suppressalis]|nr:hypothetical protein evm_014987 [Chilo suppressalis]